MAERVKRIGAEHDGGQYQVCCSRPEGACFAGKQGVYQQETGDWLNEVLHRDPARYGGQVQLHREQQNQQQAPPKNGHGVAGQRDTHDAVVEDGVALDGGNDACRNANQKGKHNRADSQFNGGRKERGELAQHVLLGDDGFAQVAVEHFADVDAVLHHDRLVQPVLFQEDSVACRINAAFASQGFDGIARNQAYQEEGEQGHAEEGRNDQAQSCKDESQHEGVDSRHAAGRRFVVCTHKD
jgi:hypothetical protein